MSKSRDSRTNREPKPEKKLRPAPSPWQKILLVLAALMLLIWLIVLAVLAMV